MKRRFLLEDVRMLFFSANEKHPEDSFFNFLDFHQLIVLYGYFLTFFFGKKL